LKLVAEVEGELPDDDARLFEVDVVVVAVVVGLVAEAEDAKEADDVDTELVDVDTVAPTENEPLVPSTLLMLSI